MRIFHPIDSSLLFSKNDPNDARLGDHCELINPEQVASLNPGYVIAGYPDDDGIRLNGGRPGAALGPHSIRDRLYRVTPHPQAHKSLCVYDVGDLTLDLPLPERHKSAKRQALETLSAGHSWLGLGGGHDYGYPDGAALIEWAKQQDQRPLIINFDAHMDVRPTDKGLSSGTPFYRLLEEYEEFDFAEIGIQHQCNSQEHINWAQSKGARILSFEEILLSGVSPVVQVSRFLEPWLVKRRPTFISIDIDGFSSSYAMGCSQSWPTGFEPNSFFPLYQMLLSRLDVRVLGIYEVSPPLDQDQRTAKLAAQLAYSYIYQGQ